MTAKGLPPVLAAAVTLLVSFGVLFGVLVTIAPQMVQQSQEIGVAALEGVDEVQEWLAGPPLSLDTEQVDDGIERAITWLRDQSADIASGVFTGVSTVGSGLVTIGLVLVLTFFFLKDGPVFLPWLRTVTGRTAGLHLTEVLTRNWRTLGGFIRTQAVVSAVDAVFIGAGLLLLGVPLALALALLTFFAGFIPIVGAVTAGALAVLVALVSNGWQVALTVLGLVVLVQQIEGNVLQPALQGRTMQMHAGIILLSVAIGGTIFGIVGAFLAVPLSACLVVTLRYVSEQVDLRAGDQDPGDLPVMTPEGDLVKTEGAQSSTNHTGDENKTPAGQGRAHPEGRLGRLARVLRR
jgi:predicted PurR-regulated permease PerM